jgi:hypothetical protein
VERLGTGAPRRVHPGHVAHGGPLPRNPASASCAPKPAARRAGSDCQFVAALAAPRRQDRPAGAGAHAQTESVLLVTPTVVGLVGALHWKYSMLLYVTALVCYGSCVPNLANADLETGFSRRAVVIMSVVRSFTLVEQRFAHDGRPVHGTRALHGGSNRCLIAPRRKPGPEVWSTAEERTTPLHDRSI